MGKKVGIGFLIIAIIAIGFVIYQSSVDSDTFSINNNINYEGTYSNNYMSAGLGERFAVAYLDYSGFWGTYTVSEKTNNQIEILFLDTYKITQGTRTYEVATRVYDGATIKKENGNIVMYLHFRDSVGDTVLIKK